MILLKQHLYTELVIQVTHMKKQYSGPVITLSEIRETYWINGSLSTVKHYIKKCSFYIRRCAKPREQMMGNLPPGHLAVNQPALTRTGMDLYGPFTISQGRGRNATVKVWRMIFTCLST